MNEIQPTLPTPARLELRNLCVEVSDTFCLDNICLSLIPGHVHILMGENGSGKSSLIHAIAGNLKACGGQILFEGQLVQFNTPADAKALGIATAYQNANLFHNLTVAENIFVDRLPRQAGGLRPIDWARLYADTDRLLARLGFAIPSHKRVGQLNVARQQQRPQDQRRAQNRQYASHERVTDAGQRTHAPTRHAPERQ